MAQPAPALFILALWSCVALSAERSYQPPTARSAEPQTVDTVTLGQSVVALNRPWKFRVGDSPVDSTTGRPVWADPGFDDAQWEVVDLTPQEGSFDPVAGLSGYVPGWTARGHPGYWGYAWYRIRVTVTAQPGQRLALAGPADVDDIYQVFLNGLLLGSFGDFSSTDPVAYYTQPVMFEIPESQSGSEGHGSRDLLLAFRVWMEPSTIIASGPDVGGFHSAPCSGRRPPSPRSIRFAGWNRFVLMQHT